MLRERSSSGLRRIAVRKAEEQRPSSPPASTRDGSGRGPRSESRFFMHQATPNAPQPVAASFLSSFLFSSSITPNTYPFVDSLTANRSHLTKTSSHHLLSSTFEKPDDFCVSNMTSPSHAFHDPRSCVLRILIIWYFTSALPTTVLYFTAAGRVCLRLAY